MSPLSLAPVSALALPDPTSPEWEPYRTQLRTAALALIASVPDPRTSPTSSPSSSSSSSPWVQGKTFHQRDHLPTATYSTRSAAHPPPGAGDTQGFKWHARRSTHDPSTISFDQFEHGLLHDHSTHEAQYIESCDTARRLAVLQPGQVEVWQTQYTNPSPAARRDFVFLLLTESLPPRPAPTASDPARTLRSFLVVTLPAIHPDAPETRASGVRGRYVSVEHVREEEDGSIVWTMAVSSSAGGSIPRWLSERALPSKIAHDVPAFVHWAQEQARTGAHG